MRYEDKKIKNLSQLLENLAKDIKPKDGPVWFRGHGKKDWNLVPSIFRGNSTKREIDYLKEFKQDATLLVEQRPQHQYEWLFIMRHHFVPTRLLDWTESPLVATFFALEDDFINSDGVLWMISPLKLNNNIKELADTQNLPTFEEDVFLKSYSPDEFAKALTGSSMPPVAFLAPRNTKRMQSQLSVFTINHLDKKPLETIGDKQHVWRYIIPKTAKKTLKKELNLLKINKFQLFPELSSIHDKIKEVFDN